MLRGLALVLALAHQSVALTLPAVDSADVRGAEYAYVDSAQELHAGIVGSAITITIKDAVEVTIGKNYIWAITKDRKRICAATVTRSRWISCVSPFGSYQLRSIAYVDGVLWAISSDGAKANRYDLGHISENVPLRYRSTKIISASYSPFFCSGQRLAYAVVTDYLDKDEKTIIHHGGRHTLIVHDAVESCATTNAHIAAIGDCQCLYVDGYRVRSMSGPIGLIYPLGTSGWLLDKASEYVVFDISGKRELGHFEYFDFGIRSLSGDLFQIELQPAVRNQRKKAPR